MAAEINGAGGGPKGQASAWDKASCYFQAQKTYDACVQDKVNDKAKLAEAKAYLDTYQPSPEARKESPELAVKLAEGYKQAAPKETQTLEAIIDPNNPEYR